MMTKIFFVRHAQPEYNHADDRTRPLTEEGLADTKIVVETLKDKGIDVMIICINGRLGNMNAEDAARLTKILSPRVGIPTHYGMFASNTEDPTAYTSRIDCGYILEYNREYSVKEILTNV